MRKIIFAVVLPVLILAMGICAYAADKIPYGVSKAANSVVRITVKKSFGTEAVTGIVVGKGSKSRYILTSLRAIEGGSDITADAAGDQIIKAAGVIATAPEKDIAVIELTEDMENVKAAKFKKKDVKDGTAVYALGYYSRDDAQAITDGAVNSKNTFAVKNGSEPSEVYQVTAQMSDRNNGGALVDKNGNVVGVNFYDGNVNQNKAITSGEVIKVLDQKEIPYKKANIIYMIAIIAVILAVIAAAVYMIIRAVKRKQENIPAIIGISGEFAGQKITVGTESISIGRDAKSCQVVLMNDSKISRCHCSIRYDGMRGMFALTDLSSTHGTFLNGNEKLEPKVPVYIADGTVFRVGGNTSFQVSAGGAH